MVWGNNCKGYLDGTSFASPHTAGTAGLMISYMRNKAVSPPNQLDPEDIEEVMQLTATDLSVTIPNNSYSYAPGPDLYSGYGRLNAGEALQKIKYPDYMIKHFSATVNGTTAVLQASNEITCLRNNLQGLPNGTVNVDRYLIQKVVSHSIPNGYTLAVPSRPGWERDAASNLMGKISSNVCLFCGNMFQLPCGTLPNAPDITSTISATGATLTGFVYGIHDPANPLQIFWEPQYLSPQGGTAKFEYSLYLKSLTINVEENALTEHAITIFPNPADDRVYITSHLQDLTKVNVTVYNIIGQVMIKEVKVDLLSINQIDVSGLKNGVYLFSLTNGGTKLVKKVIINR
jgi:hypothetical protein